MANESSNGILPFRASLGVSPRLVAIRLTAFTGVSQCVGVTPLPCISVDNCSNSVLGLVTDIARIANTYKDSIASASARQSVFCESLVSVMQTNRFGEDFPVLQTTLGRLLNGDLQGRDNPF